jgi:hypothetical protein
VEGEDRAGLCKKDDALKQMHFGANAQHLASFGDKEESDVGKEDKLSYHTSS